MMQNKDGLLSFAGPRLRATARKIDLELRKLGCYDYVKTIYVGYEVNGVMVAALYPHPDHLEVALALDEKFRSKIVGPADHLSWRTLPVSAVLTRASDFADVKPLLFEAFSRVEVGDHDVTRNSEYFKEKRGTSRGRSTSGKNPDLSRKAPKKKR